MLNSMPLFSICDRMATLAKLPSSGGGLAIVPVTNLRHFMYKASMTSIHAEANAHSTDRLMSIF